ncbi:hypothetical protein ACHAQH_002664 [Verticillium albo-atrum]
MKCLVLAALIFRLLLASVTALPTSLAPRKPDFLDNLPGIVDDLVATTISVIRALKAAIKDDALVRNELAPVLDGNSTAAASAVCPDVAVLFARGAKEPGNVGFLTGPPLFQALETYINGTSSLAIQGVNYTSISRAGAGARMAELAVETAERCPDTKIAMAGYSFGAGVVRSAVEGGNTTVMSVVLFGDPSEGDPVEGVDAGVVRTFCHEGDLVCQPTGASAKSGVGEDDGIGEGEGEEENGEMAGSRRSVVGPHLDYSLDAPAAAMFVMQKSGLGVASDDAMNEGMDGTVVGMVQQIMRNADRGIASERRWAEEYR